MENLISFYKFDIKKFTIISLHKFSKEDHLIQRALRSYKNLTLVFINQTIDYMYKYEDQTLKKFCLIPCHKSHYYSGFKGFCL